MSDYIKVSNDISSSSVDSLNTNSCSSKNSSTTNEIVNSIKYQGKFSYLIILDNCSISEIVAAKKRSFWSNRIWQIMVFSLISKIIDKMALIFCRCNPFVFVFIHRWILMNCCWLFHPLFGLCSAKLIIETKC